MNLKNKLLNESVSIRVDLNLNSFKDKIKKSLDNFNIKSNQLIGLNKFTQEYKVDKMESEIVFNFDDDSFTFKSVDMELTFSFEDDEHIKDKEDAMDEFM